MDLFAFAEENLIISWGMAICVGLLQGAILGRGIRSRFPSLKRHARVFSLILLVLFSITATANVVKFAVPEKFEVSNLSIPSTVEDLFYNIIGILGLDGGFWAAMVTFVSITLFLFFRFANLSAIGRYFVFLLSVIVVGVALLARFSDYVPTIFHITMYAFYQFGITVGIFLITRRKTDVLSEIR